MDLITNDENQLILEKSVSKIQRFWRGYIVRIAFLVFMD